MRDKYHAAVQAPDGAEGENVIEVQGIPCYVFEFLTEQSRDKFIKDVYDNDGTEALPIEAVERD